MPQAEPQIKTQNCHPEAMRLAALSSTGILDTPPEPSYDAITRLSAEYFQADMVFLGFADESRVWIKSYSGEPVRELPRKNSIFDMVLEEDGPVVVPDIALAPQLYGSLLLLRRINAASFASAPVRSSCGKILGVLTIVRCQPHPDLSPEALRMLESLADMVASQLELRRLRTAFPSPGVRRSWPSGVGNSEPTPGIERAAGRARR